MTFRGVFSVAAACAACIACAASNRGASAAPMSAGALSEQATSEQQPPEYTEAIQLFTKRDFDGALKKFEEVTKRRPDLPPAPLIMAQLFQQAQIPQGVRDYLQRATTDYPNDPEGFVILAEAFNLPEGRLVEADLLFAKASSLLANFDGGAQRKANLTQRVLSGQAVIRETRKDWDGAQKLLEQLVAQSPKDVDAMQRLARARFRLKDAAGALAMLRKAKEIDPTVLQPEAMLASFYEGYPDHENAKKWMNEALRLAPEDIETRLHAGEWALMTGQVDFADEQASKANHIDPKSLNAMMLRGAVAMFKKKYSEAETWFQDALQAAPDSSVAKNNLALALAEQGDRSKLNRALAYASDNLRLNQNSPDANATYGWVLYNLDRKEEAAQAIRRALSINPSDPDTLYFAARLAYDLKQFDQASGLLKVALDQTRSFPKRPDAEDLKKSIAQNAPAAGAAAKKP